MSKKLQSLLAALAISTLSVGALAQSENPFIGTWDIDFVQSDFGSAAVPQNMSRTYADLGDGNYMYLVVTISEEGTLGGSSASYSYSGEQYPIASLDELQAAHISYRKINETTVEYTIHAGLGGEVSQIGAKFISPSYQLLTIGIQFPNSDLKDQVLVFNRRR